MKHAVHFSSGKDDWATPPELFAVLHREFNFCLDAAASAENHKCAKYFTAADNALAIDWRAECGIDHKSPGLAGAPKSVWLNPPYSRGLQARFLRKARDESAKFRGPIVCCLIPARPDTKVWQEVVLPCASEIRFLAGRVRFVGAKASAPFPSAVVIFGQDNARKQIRGWDWRKNKFTTD